jgi:exopolysaccharide biosynthesis protein
MLVIDGRQLASLGATFTDLAEIMIEYGAVNACNLDGGSSSLMYYNGEYINNCASVIGIRPVSTTFLVLPKEDNSNG